MSNERKYQDHEVREILDLAIDQEAEAPSLPAGGGLTLGELQALGQEVGLSPSRITQAVATFEGRGTAVARTTTLGLPTTVGNSVSLPRNLSDHEWERLIAELRTTFGETGVVSSHGSLREWTYGSLHAFIEPTETGYRLRLTNSRASVLGVGTFMGGMFMALGLLVFIALLAKGDTGTKMLIPILFSGGGAGLIALAAMSLPGWARVQEKRMEHICSYAVSLLAAPGKPDE